MSIFDQIVIKIINEQALIIGPIAWAEARKVKGIHIIDQKAGTLSIDTPNERVIVDELVSQYEHLFGRASHEVCRDAVAALLVSLPLDQIPASLK